MNYNQKLEAVLSAATMATASDLDRLYNVATTIGANTEASKKQKDMAALCSRLPYLDENDTELLASSARSAHIKE